MSRVLGLTFAFVALAPLAAHADTLYGMTGDTDVRSDLTVLASTSNTLSPGGSGSPALDRSSVYVFQLPDLGPMAAPFESVEFKFNFTGIAGSPPNIDLYGIPRRASATVLASDYYGESALSDPTNATLLQTNILTPSTPVGVRSSSSTGNAALRDFLNVQYANGAGAGQRVFLRFSSKSPPGGVNRYNLTAADGGVATPVDTRPRLIFNEPPELLARPFIWVRDSEKAGILSKITNNAWATSVYNGMVSRVANDVASHQSDRDAFLRQLPVVWTTSPAKFKTIPAYAESTVRYPAEAKFNDAVDCAVLFYLTGDANYARCAADILHNSVKTLLPVAASTSTGNGGWIFQSDFLKEARVTGTQLPIIYDFLYAYLQANQVYDVQTGGMVDFNFTTAQSVFRKLYQLSRDHGQKESNWSALMATTMLNNLLALDDEAERAAAVQVYLTTGSSRQASLQYDYRHYSQTGNIWPESLQYAGSVGSIRTSHMVLLERYDPTLNLFGIYPNLPLSLPRISYMRYPNGEQISFGDGSRSGSSGPFSVYEMIYQNALARGRTDLTSFFGSLINGAVADGTYNRSSLRNYGTLGLQNEPLQLLWQAPVIAEPGVTPELPRTDRLPFAGIALQRNPAPTNHANHGLMAFVGGAAHVHSHASGMSMELYGAGEVLGAKSGRTSYGTTDHENYYRLFASNNTVIVNGGSRGQGGWQDLGINTVQTVAIEPQPFAQAVSPNHSFTTSSFVDNKGTLAMGTQQRTMSIVRTSPTSGFYVDFFRTKSTVTNRTATTLNGSVTNQYHDYIYRNVGNLTPEVLADGAPAQFVSQPGRFQNDIGDLYDQPGWRYFTDTGVTYPATRSMRARFVATISGLDRCMTMHMPAVASREIARVSSPAIVDAPSPYTTARAPALVIRQIGDAWDKPFATVYEPHLGSSGSTVQNVTQLLRGNIVVGVKVESTVGQKNLVHYVLSNPAAGETYTNASVGLSFTGRFGIAADNGDGTTTLYLGEGSSMSYRGNSVATVSGAASQAEILFTPGQPANITSNAPVNVVSAPPPAGFSWVPTAGGTGYDWNQTGNWNPATLPNAAGAIAYKNINITGDQTVNVNIPVTLGELVIGDSSGGENTLLQKNTNGSLVFDQTENGVAYLTRSANGTGTVTFADDLNITLNDNLAVRQAGGTADSMMVIAGTLAGAGKSLAKEGGNLTLSLAGANTYSGATRILGGILSLDHSAALQNSVLDTVNSIAGDATSGLRTTASSLTLGGLIGQKDLASMFTSTSGGYSGVTALTLNPGFGAIFDSTGVIANGAANMNLTKTGAGTQVLSGINTYSGNTAIAANSGTLQIGGNGRLGNGTYNGSIAIGSGSIFSYSSSAGQTLSGAISGSGAFIKNSASSTLTLSGPNTSFTGSLTLDAGTITLGHANALSGATAITLSGTPSLKTSVQNAALNAPVALSGNPTIHAPDFGSGSTVSTLTLNGAISGSGNLTFSSTSIVASNSQQTVRLTAQNDYSGSTTLNPASNDANLILRLGIANALPSTTVLSINGVAAGGSGRFARVDLSGFNQTIAGLQNTAASQRTQQITSSTAATLTIDNTSDHSFSGALTNNLRLEKNGAGTQTFSAENNFSGTTTLNDGKLRGVVGGNFANSAVTLTNASASLAVVINDNTKTWTCAALTTSAAGKLEFDFGAILPGSVSPLTVTGLAGFSTSPGVRVITSTGFGPGTYPLMTWGSTSGTAPSVVQVLHPSGTGGLADGSAASLAVVGNTLNLVVVGVPVAVKANNTSNLNLGTSWVGGTAPNSVTTATWNNTVTTANTTVLGADVTWAGISITNPGGAVTINAGNSLTLGANATDINMSSATADLTLNGPLILGDANVWNVASGRTLTLGGTVSGAFPVTKDGAGAVILSVANSYSGGTMLAADSGILEIGGSGTLGGGTYAGAIALGSNSIFRYNSSAAQTLSGPIGGSGTLTKNAGSTLTLGGANTEFTGPIVLNSGALNLGSADALGAASSLTIAGGAALSTRLTGISTKVPIALGAAASTSTISFSRNISAQGTLTLHGVISGNAHLTFTTPDVVSGGSMQTIQLGSENIYAGNTTITTGNQNNSTTIRALVADSLPTSTVLSLNGGNAPSTSSGRSVNFDLNSFDQTLAGLTNTTGLTKRAQRILNSGGESVTLTINNPADYTFSGNIDGIGLNLFKSGAGTQTLSAANSFTGGTTVGEGILSLGHSQAMQNSALNTLDSVQGDSTNGFSTTVTALTLGGLIGEKDLASVFTTTSGAYSGVTALTLNPGAEATHDYSGTIANGAAGMALTKTGLGTQILSGSNTYTGATTLSAGTLVLGANHVLPDASSISIGSAVLDARSFIDAVGTLEVTGSAQIKLGTGAALSFGDSSAIDWTGGTLTLTGPFVAGSSIRFGNNSEGLTPAQLALISSPDVSAFALNADGYLIAAGYETWAATHAATTGADPSADEDQDGVANAVEYVLGGTLATNDRAKLPAIATSGANLVFTFIRDHASIDGTTALEIELGSDLAAWTTSYPVPDTAVINNPGISVQKGVPASDKDTVTLTFPLSDLKKFARLKVAP